MKPENNRFNPQSKVEELTDHVKAYVNTSYELFRLKTVDKVSSTSSSLLVYIIVFCIFGLILTLASIGAALLLGTYLGNLFSDFFIVAGFYAVIGLFIYLGRNFLIRKPFTNKIINEILNH